MPDIVYDAQLGAPSSTPFYLRQVTNSDFDLQYRILTGKESGSPYAATYQPGGSGPIVSAHFIESGDPVAQLTTMDVGNFMTAFGVQGALIADGSTVLIPYHKRAHGGTFATGSSNMLVQGTPQADSINKIACPALLVPGQLTAPRNGPVTANGQVIFLSGDGLTNPVETKVNQALAAQAFQAMFGLGPVYINSTYVGRMVGVNVNFGIKLSDPQRYDGMPYASDIFVEDVDPVIEITVEDFDQWSGFASGAQLTQFSCFFRARTPGGTYVSDATTQHLSITIANGMVVPGAIRAADTKHGQAMLRIQGVQLVFTAGVAVAAP